MFNSPMLLDFNSNSKRSKITKACDNCRRRRVKCDGVPDGCGGCKAAKTQCVYTTSNTKRGPPKGYVEVIEDRLGKIENMLAGIVKKKQVVVPSSNAHRSTDKHSDIEDDDNNQNDDDDEDDFGHASEYDLVEVKKQPPASPALRPSTPVASSTSSSSRNVRSGSITASPLGRHSPLISRNRSLTSLLPFANDSHLQYQHQMAAQREYPGPVSQSDMAALTNMFDKLGTTSVRTTVPFPWLTPEQSRQYGRNYLQFSAQSLEPPLPALSRTFPVNLAPDTIMELFNAYFENINSFLPIVHKPTFMAQWQQVTCSLCLPGNSSTANSSPSKSRTNPQDAERHKEHVQNPVAPLSPLLLNALLAVATKAPGVAKSNPETRQRIAAMTQGFFDAARLMLDEFLDVPRVSTVQALCLMSQYHHQGQWKATRSSGYLSSAIRMAHELGLNRDPEMVTGPEADALRYLWWSMFILDHQFSAWLGLGLLMHGKESNVELPVVDVASSPQDVRGFLCLIRLVKILGSVLQHSYSTQSLPPQFGGHDSMVNYIEGSLTSWLSNLTPEMRWQNPNGSGLRRGSPASPLRSPHPLSVVTDAKIAVSLAREAGEIYPAYLYIVYNTTLILLHRPYIVGAAGSPAAAQSNTICTGSGRAITDIAVTLDMDHCSYVVNRFALYALLQAGVIHAMNAVYDKRGSEVAMEYYRRTVRVLEGFLRSPANSGGVAEGIKILEQFLASTTKAAADQDGELEDQDEVMLEQVEGLPKRKRRQVEAATVATPEQILAMDTASTQIQQQAPNVYTMATAQQYSTGMTPSTLSMMTSPEIATGSINPSSLVYDYNQQQQRQQQQQQQQQIDLKEQQKQQQLKIQQQHRLYQQMQTFGTGVKVETKAESEQQKLEQQQQQQQQLMRQQLQRQQQRQQMEMEMKDANAAAHQAVLNTQQQQASALATPVIPSHRYAMQILAQQQQQQQQQQHLQQQHHHHQGAGQAHMPMTMTMTALTMEAQNKMNQDFQLGSLPGGGLVGGEDFSNNAYDPSRFWVDFSGAGQAGSQGTINPAGLEQDANSLRIATAAGIAVSTTGADQQFGAGPLWM
ncbi:hypothetical protein BGZ83_005095 [Gryganskiella cystojenkinii]|nr:hypothetical protein BGZ83_005095 [Gryganskiella cystojenkinii]